MEEKLKQVEKHLKRIISRIQHNKVDFGSLKRECSKINKHLIIIMENYPFEHHHRLRFERVNEIFKKLSEYIKHEDARVSNKHLKLLSFINLSILPIGIITGFYGMNFKSLGSPSLSSGQFALNSGHYIVFFLMFLSLVLTSSFFFIYMY